MSATAALSGCMAHDPQAWAPPELPKPSAATGKLRNLPGPGQKVAIAVYGFTDQTGQFKHSDGAQTLSRAVTQGATSVLVQSLQEAGNGQWFTVIERERLDNLLRERAVIREMRASYLGEKQINPQALPPLMFAGVLLEGGIIGYDTNTRSGGAGARFLGIGGESQYREDTVTIYLRAVSVKTGEVLSSVSVRKSIASVAFGADAFRYVAFKELLELEAGVTFNEPDELALRQAIEEAIHSLIMEGAMQDLWCFNTTSEYGQGLLAKYVAERENRSAEDVRLPLDVQGMPVNGTCESQARLRLRSQPMALQTSRRPDAGVTPTAGMTMVRNSVANGNQGASPLSSSTGNLAMAANSAPGKRATQPAAAAATTRGSNANARAATTSSANAAPQARLARGADATSVASPGSAATTADAALNAPRTGSGKAEEIGAEMRVAADAGTTGRPFFDSNKVESPTLASVRASQSPRITVITARPDAYSNARGAHATSSGTGGGM